MAKLKLNKAPFEGPGRLIFWVIIDLAFFGLSVQQNIWYDDHNNVAETIFFLILGIFWGWSLWFDLDRWYVPKKFPAPEE